MYSGPPVCLKLQLLFSFLLGVVLATVLRPVSSPAAWASVWQSPVLHTHTLIVLTVVVALHSVGLSRACLPIREYCSMVACKDRCNHGANATTLIELSLTCLLVKYFIKLETFCIFVFTVEFEADCVGHLEEELPGVLVDCAALGLRFVV